LNELPDAELAHMLAVADDATLTRVLFMVNAATLTRVLSADDRAMARISRFQSLNVPIVPDLDKRVAEAVEQHGLNMGRYAWVITLAGEAGAALENALGPEMAGRLIYEASTGRIAPDPYMSNEEALADIRRCA
jgi:hypothetical protein